MTELIQIFEKEKAQDKNGIQDNILVAECNVHKDGKDQEEKYSKKQVNMETNL